MTKLPRVVTKNMRKLIIGFLNKIMNQVIFLQFLDAKSILHMSMGNKKFRKFLDPLHMMDKGRRNPRLAKVFAIHMLPNGEKLQVTQIERTFGLIIRKISDVQYLDGRVQKDKLR